MSLGAFLRSHRGAHGAAPSFWPWTYLRRSSVQGLPGPGSENLSYTTLAIPKETPIGPGVANHRVWWFQMAEDYVPHLTGVQGLGGLQNQYAFTSGGPLTVTQPTTQNAGTTININYPG